MANTGRCFGSTCTIAPVRWAPPPTSTATPPTPRVSPPAHPGAHRHTQHRTRPSTHRHAHHQRTLRHDREGPRHDEQGGTHLPGLDQLEQRTVGQGAVSRTSQPLARDGAVQLLCAAIAPPLPSCAEAPGSSASWAGFLFVECQQKLECVGRGGVAGGGGASDTSSNGGGVAWQCTGRCVRRPRRTSRRRLAAVPTEPDRPMPLHRTPPPQVRQCVMRIQAPDGGRPAGHVDGHRAPIRPKNRPMPGVAPPPIRFLRHHCGRRPRPPATTTDTANTAETANITPRLKFELTHVPALPCCATLCYAKVC